MNNRTQVDLQIYTAALQGFIAGNGLYNLDTEEAAQQAVDFARACVRKTYNDDSKKLEPVLT